MLLMSGLKESWAACKGALTEALCRCGSACCARHVNCCEHLCAVGVTVICLVELQVDLGISRRLHPWYHSAASQVGCIVLQQHGGVSRGLWKICDIWVPL